MRGPDVFKIGSVWVGVRVELCTADLGLLQIKLPSLERVIVYVIHNTYTSVFMSLNFSSRYYATRRGTETSFRGFVLV